MTSINRLSCQTDCKVTRDARLLVCSRQCPMAEDFIPHILLRPAYPIGASYMEAEQSIEVNIRPVHHVEGIRLRLEDVQLVAIVPPAMCNMDVCRNAASEIQKGMHPDPLLYFPSAHVANLTLMDMFVAVLVDTGKRRLVDRVTESEVIENLTMRLKTQADDTKRIAISCKITLSFSNQKIKDHYETLIYKVSKVGDSSSVQ